MSIEINSKVICDGCGIFIEGKPGTSTTTAWESPSDAKMKSIKEKWIELDHGRYYKRRHFCSSCQDKPLPKLLAKKKRPPQDPPCKISYA